MNDNKKIRAPKLAITTGMIDAGINILDKMTSNVENHTDDALVAGIFYEMWCVMHEEMEEVRRKKATVNPFVKPTTSKLILPPGVN